MNQEEQRLDDMQQSQATTEENKLGVMPVGKLLFSLALPAIAAQIVNLLYNMVDRIYIGHIPGYGSLALTGVGITFPIIILIAAFASLIGFGGAPRASIAMGKGDNKEAERILGNCVFTLVILAVILTVIFSLFAEPILYAFGASDETIVYAKPYIRIYVQGTLFVQITTGLNAFITSQGFSGVGMKTVMIGAGLNLVLDPIFIFGFGMGVQGAALATILSQAVSAVWVLSFLCGKKTILRVHKENMGFSFAVMGPVLALGISPFIMQSTESILSVCFNTSLQKYGGDLAVGAMTILASVMQVSMMPLHQAHVLGLDNYHNAFASIYEGRYLAGVAAGLKLNEMIEAGDFTAEEAKMGYIGAFTYAEVVSGYTSFYLGAKSVCPTVTMDVTFTGSWYDETAEKEAAIKLIDGGCKLISQHADSMGAPTACENAGVPNVSYNGSTVAACPNTFIVSSRINWAPYFEYIITSVANGTAIDTDWTGTIATDSVQLSEINEAAAAAGTADKIAEVIAALNDGSLKVFDASTFTKDGETVTEYLADVDGDYTGETNAVLDGYFHESEFRSAPYFDMQIDGINLLDTKF